MSTFALKIRPLDHTFCRHISQVQKIVQRCIAVTPHMQSADSIITAELSEDDSHTDFCVQKTFSLQDLPLELYTAP